MYDDLMEIDLSGWEWEVLELDRAGTLRLIGAVDLTYHWDIEVRFEGCQYLSLPTHFYDARFASRTPGELGSIAGSLEGDAPPVIIAVTVNDAPARHLIAAASHRGGTRRTSDM